MPIEEDNILATITKKESIHYQTLLQSQRALYETFSLFMQNHNSNLVNLKYRQDQWWEEITQKYSLPNTQYLHDHGCDLSIDFQKRVVRMINRKNL